MTATLHPLPRRAPVLIPGTLHLTAEQWRARDVRLRMALVRLRLQASSLAKEGRDTEAAGISEEADALEATINDLVAPLSFNAAHPEFAVLEQVQGVGQ